VIRRLEGLPLALRFLVRAAGLVLAFFAAFILGAGVGLLWQGDSSGLRTGLSRGADTMDADPPRVPSPPNATDAGGSSEGEAPDGAPDVAASAPRGDAEKPRPREKAGGTAFLHRATEENSRGDYTYLDVPGINGDPNAVVFAKAESDGTYGHNIGVWYEFADRKRWAIFNQDLAPVPSGSAFEVVVLGGSEALVHRATPENTSANLTRIDDPLTNGKPEALVSVTQNWNPGGGGGVYNDHPVDVRYDAERGQWTVYNRDFAPIRAGVAFNVGVSER
jgi:hypothetical protein